MNEKEIKEFLEEQMVGFKIKYEQFDFVAHELWLKLNQPGKVNDCKPSALCVGCIDFTCDKIYQSAPDIREEIAEILAIHNVEPLVLHYRLFLADKILSLRQKAGFRKVKK